MGRRTIWWRALAAVGAVLCATATLPGQAAATGTPSPYAYAEDATTVEGATSTLGAVRLLAGQTYRSSLGEDGKVYFRLDLNATADAYVSATAVPEPGTEVASSDGVRVSVQDADAHRCSTETARFGPTRSPHPVTAWASREIGSDPYMCQGAGTYYVLVERVGTGASSPDTSGASAEWGLELAYVSEPARQQGGSTTAPDVWNSASPEALPGAAESRGGGTSFAAASPVAHGVWEDEDGIRPGRTLYYKVPVDWGQQVHATVELGSASGDEGGGLVAAALVMSLYNPVRGFVDDALSRYDGRQRSTDIGPLPPVSYDNRFAVDDEMGAMCFAGWYYLAVHLGAPVAERFGDGPFGLTLRVRVDGAAQDGPAYVGVAEPQGVFEVTGEELQEAESGAVSGSAGGAAGSGDAGGAGEAEGSSGSGNSGNSGGSSGSGGDDLAMELVAAGGIGTGTLLVLGLGVWTVVARWRARAAVPTEAGGAVAQHGAPRAW